MRKPHTSLTRIVFILALFASALSTFANAQQAAAQSQSPAASASDPSTERGVEFYRQGEWKAAAKEFRSAIKRRKDDAVIWLYLGQSLFQNGEAKDARKAFETSLRLKPDYADAHVSLAYLLLTSGNTRDAEAEARKALDSEPDSPDAHFVLGQLRLREGAWLRALAETDAVIAKSPGSASAYMLRTEALLGLYERGSSVLSDERRGAYDFDEKTVEEARAAQPQRLREAAESFEMYARLTPNSPEADEMREQLESLRYYAEASVATDPARRFNLPSETTTRPVIIAKPEPSFTEQSRYANVRGTVRLRAVLDADGTVRHILVLRRLSHGLTRQAVNAARNIKFKPATLNGLPVAQLVILEYNFNAY